MPFRFVDQHRAARQQAAVTLKRQIDERIEQRMTGGHQIGLMPAGRIRLVEPDPPVARQHGIGRVRSDGCARADAEERA